LDAGRGFLVDRDYRTALGTGFYDRDLELDSLEEKLQAVRTLIVYGPRNVGKSELVRYFLAKKLSGGRLARILRRAVIIDARLKHAEPYLGRVGVDALRLAERLLDALGAPRGLVGLVEELASLAALPLTVFIDEFHLLIRGSLEDALAELEAAAGALSKRGEAKVRLVVSVSEGFFATSRAWRRLYGYSTSYMLVEPMNPQAFKPLYEEYRGKYGCNVDLNTFTRLAGTSPGYLVDLCPRSGKLLEEWLRERLNHLDTSLHAAAEAAGIGHRESIHVAAQLLAGRSIRDPRERRFIEKLVEENIAYPCIKQARYLPQLPLYAAAVEAAREAGLDDITQLAPEQLKLSRVEPKYCRE